MPEEFDPLARLEADARPASSKEPSVAQGFSPALDGGADDEVHLLDLVRALYKRRWIAVTAFLVVVLSVTVYTFTAIPIYEARLKLLIESDTPNFINFQQVIEEGQTQANYYQTQYDILQSRSLARQTLEAQRLWEHPAFVGDDDEDPSFSVRSAMSRTITAVVSSVAQLFGSADGSAVQLLEEEETLARSRVIDTFLGGLQVTPVRNSRIVDLTFRSADPRLATDVVNTLARAYIDQNLEFKFAQSIEASDWLGERLTEQRQQVEQSESELQRYREENDAISLDERQDIVVQKLADVNSAVTRARTERIEKEAEFYQLQATENDRDALDTFPAILTNGFIQQQKGEMAALLRQQAQLAENLGDRHPDMIMIRSAIQSTQARIEGETANVVRSVRTEFLTAQAQEESLVEALEAQKNEALSLNRKGIDYGVLQRGAESNRQLYESLLQRAKETGVSGELRTSNIRIIDAAEFPKAPISPRKTLHLFLGILGGGMFGVGLAFFFEYLDNRLKTPDDVKVHLGLPVLGMVPIIPPKELGKAYPLLTDSVPASFTEAFGRIRTNVLFSSADEGARSVVVTSTGPGEGKTVVSTNLALGLGQTGQRVLLIDADLRRGKIHEIFGLREEPGLSNLLVGTAKAKATVRKVSAAGVWVMTAGKTPPNPGGLLGSSRFKEFLDNLGEHFDWVVIDSPPAMAVADVSVIANVVSGVVFVVGAEMTSRRAAQTALEELAHARGRFVGAVLNRVDLDRNAYYYSQYYRPEYSEYYTRPQA